jgi:hypothetical protein
MLNMLGLGRIRRSDYGTNEDLSYCNRRTGITITIWVSAGLPVYQNSPTFTSKK